MGLLEQKIKKLIEKRANATPQEAAGINKVLTQLYAIQDTLWRL